MELEDAAAMSAAKEGSGLMQVRKKEKESKRRKVVAVPDSSKLWKFVRLLKSEVREVICLASPF